MSAPSEPNLNPTNDIVDLAIIGAGPVGLFGAFYAGLRQMSVKLIDSLDVLGGQLITLYPEKYIYDVAGFPKILAKDLAQNLIQQGTQYGAIPCLGEQCLKLQFDESSRVYQLITNRATHRARAILIAAGIGSFTPKKLPMPGLERYEDRGIFYFVKHLADFRDKRVLIVGGGDSAVDWANALAPIAAELTLIHRRDQFRAHEDSVAKMRETKTRILTFHELAGIEISDAASKHIEKAIVYDNRSKHEQDISVDAILVNIGFDSSLGPIKDWGLTIERNSVVVDGTMHTNRQGIFAAGDIANYPGKLKLIATGFGEACTAVNFAKNYLDPTAKVFPGHSSEMKRTEAK